MTLAVIASGGSLAGFGLAARSWPLILVFLLLAGAASGLGIVASNLAISRMVPAKRQGVAFGFKQAAIPMASVVAGVAVPALGLTVGWRWAFLITAAAFAAGFLATNRRTAESAGGGAHAKGTLGPLLPLLLLGGTALLASGAATAVIGFYVKSAVDRGFAEATAGLLLAAGSASGIVARVLWGWLADRWTRGHIMLLAALFAVGSAGFALLGIAESKLILGLATVLVFAAGWSWSGVLFLVAARTSPGAPATATAIPNAAGSAGGVAGPIVFGQLIERLSYTTTWLIVASWVLAAAVLAMVSAVVMRQPSR